MNTTKKKLNPNARKWVRALRSGKYKQTKGCLKRTRAGVERYCCLGVACEIAKKDIRLKVTREKSQFKFNGEDAHLPHEVVKWLGLESHAGFHQRGSLMSDNDSGKSFEKIADIIESQPLGLFA